MKAVKSVVGAPFKAIAKTSKGILKGAKKAFKSITKSSFGKALLIGATIYLGGAAFGLWNSPFQAVNGAFLSPAAAEAGVATGTAATEAGTTLAAAEGAGAAGAGAGEAAATSLANEAAVAETMTSAGAAGGGAGASGGTGILNASMSGMEPGYEAILDKGVYGTVNAAVPGGPLTPSVTGAAKTGFFSGDLAKFGLIQAGAGALQGAFSRDAIDVAEREAELERENLAWRNQFLSPNFDVGQIDLGMKPSNQPLRDMNGNLIYPAQTPQPQPPQPVVPQGFIQATLPRR